MARPSNAPELTRRPPKAIREALVLEVGFRCPVKDCGIPYLTFHHFAPPWRVKHHHDPAGMVALCRNHADKADNGYYPDEYFQALKIEGAGRAQEVSGEFDYLRRNVLALIGSNMYYDVDTVLEVGGQRQIYFSRDEYGYLRLNFTLPGAAGMPRAWLEDGVWLIPPGAEYIECPPRGRFLSVRFPNGDSFRVEYSDVASKEFFLKKYPVAKYPPAAHMVDVVEYPLTVAEFWEVAQGGDIEMGRSQTRIHGCVIRNSSVVRGRVAISAGGPPATTPTFSPDSWALIARAADEFNGGRRR